MKERDDNRMSSFIVTPYRLRRPSRRFRGGPSQSPPESEHADYEHQIQTVNIEDVIQSTNENVRALEDKLQSEVMSLRRGLSDNVTELHKQNEEITNRIEMDVARFNIQYSEFLAKLDEQDVRLNAKLDALEKKMSVLSTGLNMTKETVARLTDVPIIQKRVVGTESANKDVPIRFGELHRVVSRES